MDPNLASILASEPFKDEIQGFPMELKVSEDSAGSAVRYVSNEQDVPDENATYHQLYRLACAANDMLHTRNATYGIVIDGVRFDEKMINRVGLLLEALQKRIHDAGHTVYIFYTDTPSSDFARHVLYRSMNLHRIGRILQDGFVPLRPYSVCRASLSKLAKDYLHA